MDREDQKVIAKEDQLLKLKKAEEKKKSKSASRLTSEFLDKLAETQGIKHRRKWG
jgi:hypothetical protein